MEFKSLSDLIRYAESAFALKFYSGSAVLFLTTCDIEWLEGFGVEFEMPHKAPTYAKGYVEVTLATRSSAATVPAGTYLVDPVTGLEYMTLVETSISSSNSRLRIVATSSGTMYNLSVGALLEWRDSAPTGLDESIEVVGTGGIYGGYSTTVVINGIPQEWGETAEEYRERLLYRERNPSHGGSVGDYKQWAERFDSVSKAYVIPNNPNVNSVTVVLANYHYEEIAVHPDDVQKVEDYILAESRRVATADPRVFSATVAEFTVNANVAPFNSEVKESVNAAAAAFFAAKNPGTTSYFDDLITYVRSNSLATTFAITSATKGTNPVSVFALSLDADNEVGEIAKVTFNFSNGG